MKETAEARLMSGSEKKAGEINSYDVARFWGVGGYHTHKLEWSGDLATPCTFHPVLSSFVRELKQIMSLADIRKNKFKVTFAFHSQSAT